MKLNNLYRVVAVISIFLHTDAFAILCATDSGNVEAPSDYMAAYVSALLNVKHGQDEKALMLTKSKLATNEWVQAMFVHMKSSSKYFDCAISKLDRYAASTNKTIAQGANGTISALKRIGQIDSEKLTEFQTALDGKNAASDNKGAKANHDADREIAGKEAWEQFMLSAAATTHSVIDTEGKKPTMKLTLKQKNALIKELKSGFPKQKSKSGDRMMVDAIGDQLLKFLSDKWPLMKE